MKNCNKAAATHTENNKPCFLSLPAIILTPITRLTSVTCFVLANLFQVYHMYRYPGCWVKYLLSKISKKEQIWIECSNKFESCELYAIEILRKKVSKIFLWSHLSFKFWSYVYHNFIVIPSINYRKMLEKNFYNFTWTSITWHDNN